MHPARELNRLAAHKAAVRRAIAVHRHQCVAAAAGAGQPLVWADRLLALWRRFAPLVPLAAVPLGLLLKRSSKMRPRLLGMLVRWGPTVFKMARGFAGTGRGSA